ncbi:acyl-CoA thioesterase domain-containing protein [Novosphingobium piscinae]|uniref:Thioesterase family protein n=1 Tax=Novosphingobium piscinae TaxID=1507448 RepID=A0A7X1G1G1_9SPHN|nr:acyl-CoA thioesterase domain-containing protein [Novosphingobium piscinae]MBC2670734.1 thioesterase family protein [Novosphingobium piscinae]
MTQDALFHRDGASLMPQPGARGYWTPDSVDGRALVGLLAHEIEQRHGGGELVPARLTVDLHRLVRMQPLRIATRVIRDGARLRLIEATLSVGEDEYARALCQLLRPAPVPPGKVWPGDALWSAPAPDALPTVSGGTALWGADVRVIEGSMGGYGPRRIWLRNVLPLVHGEPLTPFARVGYAADFASPLAHWSDLGVHYINTDVTAQLHRLPRGEWIGLEATRHDASQGIAIGNCRLYDEHGAIGQVSITALTNQRG